jgi:hypothetical protein
VGTFQGGVKGSAALPTHSLHGIGISMAVLSGLTTSLRNQVRSVYLHLSQKSPKSENEAFVSGESRSSSPAAIRAGI